MKNYSSVKAQEIVQLLEEPTDDRRPLKSKLRREAHVKELVKALRLSETETTRRILCDIVGARRAKTAIPALIECLDHPSSRVQDDAAEALAKIGSPKAGDALLRHFILDPSFWLAAALGAVGYQSAIPYLIEALKNTSDEMIRGGAAWALGKLKAQEGVKALEEASIREEDAFVTERIKKALEIIRQENDTI
jgi:HEAT repeat protein